jgi:hypothetical protein
MERMINNGSEKQIAWATEIVAKWRSELLAEVEVAHVDWYKAKLIESVAKFDAAVEQWTNKQVIDLFVAKRNPIAILIKAARVQ